MFRREKIFNRILTAALFVAGLFDVEVKAEVVHDQGFVHVVYLSPSDVSYDRDYESVLGATIVDLQGWYASQLGGASFSLASNPVSWCQLANPTSFYQQLPGGPFDSSRFWSSVLDGAKPLVDWSFNDPDDIYLFYVDADPLPSQGIGGVSGVAMMGANDLRGLAGRPLVPINPNDADVWKNFPSGPARWVGGLGHELGHALGLDHPGDGFGETIMQFGYLYYPDTTLADFQKQDLLNSPFISTGYAVPVPEPTVMVLMAIGGAAGLLKWRRRLPTG